MGGWRYVEWGGSVTHKPHAGDGDVFRTDSSLALAQIRVKHKSVGGNEYWYGVPSDIGEYRV